MTALLSFTSPVLAIPSIYRRPVIVRYTTRHANAILPRPTPGLSLFWIVSNFGAGIGSRVSRKVRKSCSPRMDCHLQA
jgi:hypothetical protein